MSKLVVESEDVEVLHAYLEHLRMTRYRYEIDGASVSLKTKRYDNSGDEPSEARAARTPWSAGKKGKARELAGGYLRLSVRGERDVFYSSKTKAIVRPTRYELRFTTESTGSAQGAWRAALGYVGRGLRYLLSTFERRDVLFALDDSVADGLLSITGKQKALTASSNAGAKLRLQLLRAPETLLFVVDDPASPFIWDGECQVGDTLVLSFGGATVDAATERKLKAHRKVLRPEDLA